MRDPDISIIIPTRDRLRILPRTLLSALGQSDVYTETIVVDDGSRKPLAGSLSAEARGRVRIVRHDRPLGVAHARNSGIEIAGGRWLAFLDDDDLWAPFKLQLQLQAAEDAGADFAYAGGVAIDDGGRTLSCQAAPRASELHVRLLERNVMPYTCSNLLARADLVRETGTFDSRFHHLADWDMALRLSARGHPVAVNAPLIAYVIHGGNMHAHQTGLDEDLQLLLDEYSRERAARAVEFDRVAWLGWRAYGYRVAGDRRAAARGYRQLARKTRDPRQLARSVAMYVGGERAMTALQRLKGSPADQLIAPRWLEDVMNPPAERVRALLTGP